MMDKPVSLSAITEYPPASYSSLDLNRLVSFTVHWLLEHRIPMTFENVVVAAFRMFPAKFALEGYPEYPDAARTNRALLQLRPKYRNWARGNVQKGFVLTESGLVEVQRVKDVLSGRDTPHAETKRRQGLPRTMDLSRDLSTIVDSPLFAKWKTNSISDGTTLELLDMLQAFAYTPARALKERVATLENAARQVGRGDIVDFFGDVRKRYDQQLREVRKG
jgi:hypothetical protein